MIFSHNNVDPWKGLDGKERGNNEVMLGGLTKPAFGEVKPWSNVVGSSLRLHFKAFSIFFECA